MNSKLKIGSSVKININNIENMWVEITEIGSSKIKGKIDEHPIKLDTVSFGDSVEFTEDNVLSVLEN